MFTITSNAARFEQSLTDLARRKLPFAISAALNDTAKDVNDALRDEMERVFDRPTRFTLNAFYVWRSSPRTLMAAVQLKSQQSGRHFLYVQAFGGARPKTGLERLLGSRLRYAGIINTVTPASGMRLDRYGNMSRGRLNQILSAVQSQGDARANTTAASRARNKGRSGYFAPAPGSRLSPGIWERMASGRIRKVLHFSDGGARYQRRLDIEQVAERVVERVFHTHLRRRLQAELASSRAR